MDNLITKEDLIKDLLALGVKSGDRLNVKVSLKSIGKIEGGAETLIAALLSVVGETGTIFADAFVSSYDAYKVRLNPKKYISTQNTPSYAGAFVNAMVKYPDAKRSTHPVHKFVAIGADSDWVLEHTIESQNYSLLFRLIENNAKNLKIGDPAKVPGVGTTHCTIETLGWKQKMRPLAVSYYNSKGELSIYYHNWPTGCMKAFNKFVPLYEASPNWGSKGKIGNSFAMLTNMKESYELELNVCRKNPDFLRCDNPLCVRCRMGWKHSHDSSFSTLKTIIFSKSLKSFREWCKCVFLSKYEPR